MLNKSFLLHGTNSWPVIGDFGLIEQNKNAFPVYVPEDWIPVIATAKINDFLVCKMETEDFKDLHITVNSLVKGLFKITDYLWLKITSDDPTTLRGRDVLYVCNVLQPWISHSLAKKCKVQGSTLLH